ncbi:MAG: RlmE family RNA methyltransferase [Caldimicrobium sp.]|nr:RlmE family RNA methyltransferase [Caldimicrobium sp.]MDW8093510.1 RlmE family RNA methyltransferase [Caldimicrobium sp.]
MSSKGNPWFDKWAKLAKEKGYPARSVFKLMEIQKKYKLIRPGFRVLDLGASPGSWSQYACEIVGPQGKVVGVDQQPVKFSSKLFVFLQKDVFALTPEDLRSLGIEEFDLILSDLAPKTTGIEITDHLRSTELALRALELSKVLLKKGGSLVVKIFDGPELLSVRREFEKFFKNVKIFKPTATRKGSRELFILAFNKL